MLGNNSMFKGGVLFVDSADKATRFIQLCDAFNVPLLFLSDVPGFMVGSAVERQGIIRHGAKMITAVSEATVPKICVVVRKAYGAGLYAMSGPGFDPDATIALPTAKIAVMGAEAAVNAVYANKIAALASDEERAAFVAQRLLLLGEPEVDHGYSCQTGVTPCRRREKPRSLPRAASKRRMISVRRSADSTTASTTSSLARRMMSMSCSYSARRSATNAARSSSEPRAAILLA